MGHNQPYETRIRDARSWNTHAGWPSSLKREVSASQSDQLTDVHSYSMPASPRELREFLTRICLLAPALLLAVPLLAQEHGGRLERAPRTTWSVGAQAVPLLTRVDPALAGEARTEGYLTQPMLMGHATLAHGKIEFMAELNFEGLTLREGELNPGIWGEGFVDRRHPHTFLHEAVVVARPWDGGRTGLSLAIGKGFAPFGTDDPMVRPFVKYPANHHLAQLLERLVIVAALRQGPAVLEAGLFNGDEPTGPGDFPEWERFGDSWAVRGTLQSQTGLEVQASYAAVESPEHPQGGVLDQRKWSTSLRWERAAGMGRREYALLEWARTDELDRGRRAFGFTTLLAEGAARRRGVELAARFERTDRPEGERRLDPFRTPVPHHDISILGITRWTALTLSASTAVHLGGPARLRPFVEISRLHATARERNAAFIPREFYGADRMWSLSVGTRVEAGQVHARMGRYGAAAGSTAAQHSHP